MLCVEPDGCVALELAHASAYAGCDHGHAPPPDNGGTQAAPHCGCVDIPILTARDDASPQKRAGERDRMPPPAAGAALLPGAGTGTAAAAVDVQPTLTPRAPPLRPPAQLAHVRSVVLLL